MVDSLYSVDQETAAIWVYLEMGEDALAQVSLELLAKGRELADSAGMELVGLLLGEDAGSQVDKALEYGADRILLFDQSDLNAFNVETVGGSRYSFFHLLLIICFSRRLVRTCPYSHQLCGLFFTFFSGPIHERC